MRPYLKSNLQALLIIGLMVSNSVAQDNGIIGTWETCKIFDHVQHYFLEFTDDGEYKRIILSDNSDLPYYEEKGTYTIADGQITLKYRGNLGGVISLQTESIIYQLSEDDNTFFLDTIPFSRGRELPVDIYGTWGIMDPFTEEIRGQIGLQSDGTYEMTLDGSHEKGVFKISGSGMVHWSTEIDDPEMLNVPAVWTNIRVEEDQLSYDIACNFTVAAIRLTTFVNRISWGKLKSEFR